MSEPDIAESGLRTSRVKTCRDCGVALRLAGKAPFRLGGTKGAWKLVFGEWAELGEGVASTKHVCLPGMWKD